MSRFRFYSFSIPPEEPQGGTVCWRLLNLYTLLLIYCVLYILIYYLTQSGLMYYFSDQIFQIDYFNAGSTKDVGSALTRICVRQKMVESKLKLFTK